MAISTHMNSLNFLGYGSAQKSFSPFSPYTVFFRMRSPASWMINFLR